MPRTSKPQIALLFACVALAVSACGKKKKAAEDAGALEEDRTWQDAAVPPNPGLVFFAVGREGVVELKGGVFRRVLATEGRIDDLAIGANGDVFAVADAQILRIAAGQDNDVPELISSRAAPGGVARRIATASDGVLWAITNKGLWWWDGTVWTDDETFPRPRTVVDIVATRGGRVVAAARDSAFIREADGWREVELPDPPPEPKPAKNAAKASVNDEAEGEGDDDGVDEEGGSARKHTYVRSLALGADDRVYASTSSGVYLLGDANWKRVAEATVDALAVSADGTLVAASESGGVLWGQPDELKEREIAQLGLAAGEVDAIATDSLSRMWIATDGGLILASGEGETIAVHSLGSQAALPGRIVAVRVVTAPTILPEILERKRGAISGRVLGTDKKAAADLEIEICARPDTMFRGSPCAEAPFRGAGKTDAAGSYRIDQVPAGRYGFAFKKNDEWIVDLTIDCCDQLFGKPDVSVNPIKIGD